MDRRLGALSLLVSLAALSLAAGCLGSPTDTPPEGAGTELAADGSPTQPVFEEVARTEHVVQAEVDADRTEETWVDVYRPTEQDRAPSSSSSPPTSPSATPAPSPGRPARARRRATPTSAPTIPNSSSSSFPAGTRPRSRTCAGTTTRAAASTSPGPLLPRQARPLDVGNVTQRASTR